MAELTTAVKDGMKITHVLLNNNELGKMTPTWTTLGSVPTSSLVGPRRQLHRAARILGAVGDALVEHEADYSHSSLSWSAEAGGRFVGRPTKTGGVRAALDLRRLRLSILAPTGETLDSTELDGRTVAEAYEWIEHVLRQKGALGATQSLARPEPPTTQERGRGADTPIFRLTPVDPLEELSHWFGNAQAALAELRASLPNASPVRCWPHHFDIAILAAVGLGGGEEARSIGVGFQPGDNTYPEPYWYVTPWPYPSSAVSLPALEVGHWHREGWTGAVLTGRVLTSVGTSPQQRAMLVRFLAGAVAASYRLLDAPQP